MAISLHTPRFRRPDPNIMFVVGYADGRSAYLVLSPKEVASGDFLARSIAVHRQATGEIPAGTIANVRRVR